MLPEKFRIRFVGTVAWENLHQRAPVELTHDGVTFRATYRAAQIEPHDDGMTTVTWERTRA